MPEPKGNVRIITLGCAKNEVDCEEIAGVLRNMGAASSGAPVRSTLLESSRELDGHTLTFTLARLQMAAHDHYATHASVAIGMATRGEW